MQLAPLRQHINKAIALLRVNTEQHPSERSASSTASAAIVLYRFSIGDVRLRIGRADVVRARTNQPVVVELLDHMRGPARRCG